MEAVLDIVAGTGVILFLLATAFIGPTWGRLLIVMTVGAVAYAVHPLAVRQSLVAFVDGLDGADVQTLAAVLAIDGVLGCAGATLLLRGRHGLPVHWLRRRVAYHVGVIPMLALFYLEMKAFHVASEWPFSTTAWVLSVAIVGTGLAGSEAIRRLLPDPDVRTELRLLVHAAQVMLAAGLTAFAGPGGRGSSAARLEAGPHAAVAGTAALGILVGYWSHRRRQRHLGG